MTAIVGGEEDAAKISGAKVICRSVTGRTSRDGRDDRRTWSREGIAPTKDVLNRTERWKAAGEGPRVIGQVQG